MKNNMKKENLFKICLLIVFFLFLGNEALAAAGCNSEIVPCKGTDTDPCSLCKMFQLVNNIIMFVMTCLAPIVATLMIAIGGLYLLTSRGDPGAYTKAKDRIQASVAGLVIMFVAWIFLNTFFTYIGVQGWTGLRDDPDTATVEGNWWQVECND
jgi:hypothetical protein